MLDCNTENETQDYYPLRLEMQRVCDIQNRETAVKRSPLAGVVELIAVAAVLAAGCTTPTTNSQNVAALHQLPIASAGADQKVKVGTVVALDGSESSAPRSGALTYDWSLSSVPNDSAAQLANQTSDRPTFKPDKAGTYVVSLVVTDSSGAKSTPDADQRNRYTNTTIQYDAHCSTI